MIRGFTPALTAVLLAACAAAYRATAPDALVDAPPPSLGLPDGATAGTLQVGDTVQLSAVLPWRRGKTTRTETVWSSFDSGTAAVSETGLVRAVDAGTAPTTVANGPAAEPATIVVGSAAPLPPPPEPPPAPTGSEAELPRAYVDGEPARVTGQTITVRGSPFPVANVYAATATAAGLSSDLRVVAAPALGSRTTDGTAPGADRAAVERATAGVVLP